MALEIHEHVDNPAEGLGTPVIVADRRLHADVTKTILVEEEDPAAAYMVAAPGQKILSEWVESLKLVDVGGFVCQRGAGAKRQGRPVTPLPEPPKVPGEDKRDKGGETKGEVDGFDVAGANKRTLQKWLKAQGVDYPARGAGSGVDDLRALAQATVDAQAESVAQADAPAQEDDEAAAAPEGEEVAAASQWADPASQDHMAEE